MQGHMRGMAARWASRAGQFINSLTCNLDKARTGGAQAGFTLLEVLVVIAILGLLIGLVAPNVLQRLGGARVSVAQQQISGGLGADLDIYKLDVGSYPTTEQGLEALVDKPSDAAGWAGPYIKGGKVPLDPWNHPYSYRYPSTRKGHDYDLCSAGPGGHADGVEQGQGSICNQ